MYSPETFEIDILKIYLHEEQLRKEYHDELPWIMMREMIAFVQNWIVEHTDPYATPESKLEYYENQRAYFEKRLKKKDLDGEFLGMEYFVTAKGAFEYKVKEPKILSFKHSKFLLFFTMKLSQYVTVSEAKEFLAHHKKLIGKGYINVIKEVLENRYQFLLSDDTKEHLKELVRKAKRSGSRSPDTKPYFIEVIAINDIKKLRRLLIANKVIGSIEYDHFKLHFSKDISYKLAPKIEWLRPKHEIVYLLERLCPEVLTFNSNRINMVIIEHFAGCQNIRKLKNKANTPDESMIKFYDQIISHFQ